MVVQLFDDDDDNSAKAVAMIGPAALWLGRP